MSLMSPSLALCLSAGHVHQAGGAVCPADGGPGSERQTGGEQQTTGGDGGGATAAEGGANTAGDTGTGNASRQTLFIVNL